MTTPELKREIKAMIIEALQIRDVTPEQVADDAPLFGNPLLKLDSVDALEIIVAVQRRYGARIDDRNLARTVLQSVNSLAEFVSAQERNG